MEKKTNKAKIKNFQVFENISFITGNYALSANSIKNMLIRVFLHAEFKSARKEFKILQFS